MVGSTLTNLCWINVDTALTNVDQRRNVISTYINVESTLDVSWDTFEETQDLRNYGLEIT